jgi:hypothetical protein
LAVESRGFRFETRSSSEARTSDVSVFDDMDTCRVDSALLRSGESRTAGARL